MIGTRYTTEIKKDWRIVYPISMLAQVVGEENIRKHYNPETHYWDCGHGGFDFNPEDVDNTFHCWEDEDGVNVEGLGAFTNGLKGESLINSVEQMWDDNGEPDGKPIFYYTLLSK